MSPTPTPYTPAYAAAGVELLAKTVHVWTAPDLIQAQAAVGATTILYTSSETAARTARLLGLADEITYSNEQDGRIVHLRGGRLDGIKVTIASVEDMSDGGVAA